MSTNLHIENKEYYKELSKKFDLNTLILLRKYFGLFSDTTCHSMGTNLIDNLIKYHFTNKD